MKNENTNLIVALVLSMSIILGWQMYFEKPKAIAQKKALEQARIENNNNSDIKVKAASANAVSSSKMVKFSNGVIEGYINPTGIKFVSTRLLNYREQINDSSKNIEIFTDNQDQSYYSEFGWVSSDSSFKVPNNETVWEVSNWELTKDKPVIFSWLSDQNVKFEVEVKLDDQYMFSVNQRAINLSNKIYLIYPYGLIFRNFSPNKNNVTIIFEGLLGFLNSTLLEKTYDNLDKENSKTIKNAEGGWIGIADKYWLSSIIPDPKIKFNSNFSSGASSSTSRPSYQIDYTGEEMSLTGQDYLEVKNNLYVGPRQATMLDYYSSNLNIASFDKAVDFGIFYFLTKPLYLVLNYFYSFVNNYGIAILLLTLAVKIIMFPLASKSYNSMNKMKVIQPKVEEIKKQYANDKVKFNNELMQLYKKHNINPLSGCLPLFIQIPVFFSLYKVIFIAIEMRQAPFYGWIKDLSSPDPTSIFNLFGLINYDVSFFPNIGIWPIVMGVTMYVQQKLSPAPSDPVQAQVMKFMPVLFVVLFYSFPAGLMIYWSASNILSILQQFILMKRTDAK